MLAIQRTGVVLLLTGLAVVGCDEGGTTPKVDATPTADATALGDDTGEIDATAPDAVPDAGGSEVLPEDLDMTAADFECLTRWQRVRRFYITNKAGRLEETLAVANAPEGKQYPVGTIIQLVPFEAMVKRKVGWAPESNDWEFFSLENTAEGTTILERGTVGVKNQFGGECMPCHVAAQANWDMVCESDHGCDPLPLTEAIIDSVVANDDRCP